MHTMQLLSSINPSAQDCLNVLQRLFGPFLQSEIPGQDAHVFATPGGDLLEHPTEESPQTQINNVYSMMWPNANDAEADVLMQGGLWSDFLPDVDDPGQPRPSGPNVYSNSQFSWG